MNSQRQLDSTRFLMVTKWGNSNFKTRNVFYSPALSLGLTQRDLPVANRGDLSVPRISYHNIFVETPLNIEPLIDRVNILHSISHHDKDLLYPLHTFLQSLLHSGFPTSFSTGMQKNAAYRRQHGSSNGSRE
jgi:hypothetical protein